MARGRPGPAPQTAKREQFARLIARLIARGTSNAEACRLVGINSRTGKRWRHGRTITSSSGAGLHYPPVIGAREREISPRYLSEEERVSIADLRRAGLGVRAIAAKLQRSPSTVSRELRRNQDPVSGQYRPFTAQRLAAERRARPGRGKLIRDSSAAASGAGGPRRRVPPGPPVQPRCGVLPPSTATSWRSASSSASLAAAERASKAIQPVSRTKIRYNSRMVTSPRSCQLRHHEAGEPAGQPPMPHFWNPTGCSARRIYPGLHASAVTRR
jgi:lambda repressor-like predicted transcriptional regulator